MKKLLAMVLALVMTMSLVTIASAASFSDVDKVDRTYEVAVGLMTEKKVITGYPDGTFQPQGKVTRAEMAKMICVALLGEAQAAKLTASRQVFSDVPTTFWAAGYIDYCYSQGIVSGVGAGKFDPNGNITGYQAAKMILVAMGYTKKGAYQGTGWEVNVARDAMTTVFSNAQLGTTSKAASYNNEATREEAAYYIFNGFTRPSVVYSEAADMYYANRAEVLGRLIVAASTSRDVWGRPNSLVYTLDATDGKDVKYTANQAPVKTYTTAVTGCQLLKDLGYAETNYTTVTFNVYDNGALISTSPRVFQVTTYQIRHNSGNCIPYSTQQWGAQGRLTEVYKTGKNTYDVIYIDTYLAAIGATTKPTNSHSNTDTVALSVYNGGSGTTATSIAKTYSYTTGTASYTKGAYALVTMANGVVQSVQQISPAATATGAYWLDSPVVGTRLVNETTTVGGVTYKDADKFFLGDGIWDMTKTWNVYTDTYGNIIGMVEYVAPNTYVYGVMTAAKWVDTNSLLDSGYGLANIKKMDATDMLNTIVRKYMNTLISSSANIGGSRTNATMSETTQYNGDWNDWLFEYTLNADGSYNITKAAAAWINSQSIQTGVSNIWSDGTYTLATNDYTVYLVKTAANTYATYTGYKNVPSMSNVSVQILPASGNVYSNYVFVDATAATYEGASGYVWITKTLTDADRWGQDGKGNYGYWMFVDGQVTVQYVLGSYEDTFQSIISGNSGAALYKVTRNAEGVITGISVPSWTTNTLSANVELTNVKGADGTVITNVVSGGAGELALNMTGAKVYGWQASGFPYGSSIGIVEITDYSELVGKTAYCVVGSDNVVDAIYFAR